MANFSTSFSTSDAMKSRGALAIFCRAPRLGTVKTRIAQTRGDWFALGLYRAMLDDSLDLGRALAPEIESFACFTPPDGFEGENSLSELWDGPTIAQCEGDLGAKILDCFAQLRARGFEKIAAVGSDSPDLPHTTLTQAFEALNGAEIVIGGSADGGFYLIGAAVDLPASLFQNIIWSRDQVYNRLLFNLKSEAKLVFCSLPTWRDVDDEADLLELRRRLFEIGTVAPKTRAFLEKQL